MIDLIRDHLRHFESGNIEPAVVQSAPLAVYNAMLYDGALNAGRFIAFLRRLIKDAGQKVVLIVDNLKVHHAKHDGGAGGGHSSFTSARLLGCLWTAISPTRSRRPMT